MHKRNLHKNGYDFASLVLTQPSLKKYVLTNPSGRATIDFANPQSLRELNSALLKHHYKIEHWDIPQDYLCPPIPGRADYIHAIADLLAESTAPNRSKKIKGLDIGTGANLIYPIIGSQAYGWQFVASEIDKGAIQSAKIIQSSNSALRNTIKIRQQTNPKKIFETVVNPTDMFDFCMCNPPFHASKKAAMFGSEQKNINLRRNQSKRQSAQVQKFNSNKAGNNQALNFAGKNNELWCDGGEVGFILRMITESIAYQTQVIWFTSLVSKKDSLKSIYKKLNELKGVEHKTVIMEQGSKTSRFIAWRFCN